MAIQSYEKQFADFESACSFMKMKNQAFSRANNSKEMVCVVPGNEGNNYAVVDLKTAIELGLGYVFSTDGIAANPWSN